MPAIKGRGAVSNMPGRFESRTVEPTVPRRQRPATTISFETAAKIVTRNRSPDIPFNQSINPYRGCEHGCTYCYARPSHSYLNLSPGLDFETRLIAKRNAAAALQSEFRRAGYRCEPLALGANTDPYQPIEKRLKITRDLLEVLTRWRHPVTVITKGNLVLRDLDLLQLLAAQGLCRVAVSVTTLDNQLKRILEPRAASPESRLNVIRALHAAGIPVSVLVAPVIPAINDHEIESIVTASAEAGADTASYVLLRLPHEVAPLFRGWLAEHFPARAAHVMSLVKQTRGGRDYDARYGQRQAGTGPVADLIAQRFRRARKSAGLTRRPPSLETGLFADPDDTQQVLF